MSTSWPSPAQDYKTNELDLNAELMPNKDSMIPLRVLGDGMRGADVRDGDIIIVDKAEEPKDGDVVIATIDGELVLRCLYVRRPGIYLALPDGSTPSIRVDEFSELRIWGVMTGITRSVRRRR